LILSCRASILSLMFAALRSAFGVNVVMVMVEAVWTGIRKGQASESDSNCSFWTPDPIKADQPFKDRVFGSTPTHRQSSAWVCLP
jgi:hypothetical protein